MDKLYCPYPVINASGQSDTVTFARHGLSVTPDRLLPGGVEVFARTYTRDGETRYVITVTHTGDLATDERMTGLTFSSLQAVANFIGREFLY